MQVYGVPVCKYADKCILSVSEFFLEMFSFTVTMLRPKEAFFARKQARFKVIGDYMFIQCIYIMRATCNTI